jgi:hypothetical protein
MTGLMWLHTSNWAGYFAHPVEVLSHGAKFARVRLMHKTRIGRIEYPRGTIKHSVPLDSLSEQPSRIAFVSLGGGRFDGDPFKKASE